MVRKFNKGLIKQAKKSHLAKSLYKPLQNGDSKAFYRYLHQNSENGSNTIPSLKYQHKTAETAIEKANMLNNFFQSMFVKDDGIPVTSDQRSITNEYIDIVVTRQGVLKLLDDVDVSKSCGPDDIAGILLKTFSEVIATSLTDFFNYSLTSGCLPNIWKEAKVTAIHKKK